MGSTFSDKKPKRYSDKYDDPLSGYVSDSVFRSAASRITGRSFSTIHEEQEKHTLGPKSHLNDILDSLGFEDGHERADLLRRCGVDYQKGAEIVKKAFTLIYHQENGIEVLGNITKEQFQAVADCLKVIGTADTNKYLIKVGIDNMPKIAGMLDFMSKMPKDLDALLCVLGFVKIDPKSKDIDNYMSVN